MTFDLVDAEPVPIQGNGRVAEPNPFADVFPLRLKGTNGADDKGEAKSFTLPYKTEAEKKAYAKVKGQIHSAAKAKGVTARVALDEDKKKGTAKVTFWNIPLVKRPGAGNHGTKTVEGGETQVPQEGQPQVVEEATS